MTQYGGGTYSGVQQEQLTIDPIAQTMVYGEYLPNVSGGQYKVMTFVPVDERRPRLSVRDHHERAARLIGAPACLV